MRFAVVALVLTIGSSVGAGCSAADPGAVTFGSLRDGGSSITNSSGGGSTQGGSSSGTTGGTTGGGTTGGGTTGGGGGGTTGGGTTGGTTGAAAKNAFTGAPAYAAAPVADADQSALHHGNVSNAGLDCLGCHAAGNAGGAPAFMFAGTLYDDTAGTNPVVSAEVRVVSPAGVELGKAYSDKSGNFWLPDTGTVPAGALTGVRNGTSTKLMISAPTGKCNFCHAKTGGTTTPVSIK